MKWNKWLPIIGILIFIYIIWRIGPEKILSAFLKSNYLYVILALLFYIPIILLQTWKWEYILKKQNIHLGFAYLLRLQMISLFYGAITPGKIGSFIKIPYLCKKTKKPASECSANIILDRLFDFIAVALFASIGAILFLRKFIGFFYFSLLVFFGLFLCLIIFTNKRTSRFFLKIIFRFLVPEKLKKRTKMSLVKFYNSLPSLFKLTPAFLLTIIVWLLNYTEAYFIAVAFSIRLPYFYFITILAVVTLVTLIPITISGLGTREAALLTLLSVYKIPAEKIVGFSLLESFLAIAVCGLFGLLLLFKRKDE